MRSFGVMIGMGVALFLAALLLSLQGEVAQGIGGVRAFFGSLTNRSFSYDEFLRVRTELEGLRAERAVLLESGLSPFPLGAVKAPVYSRYPYSASGLLMVGVGSSEGVRVDAPVLAAPGVLLGRVSRVERARSEVTTIFHPSWRSSVRFEGSETKALLEGGQSPRLTLIPRGREPAEGTRVVSIDPGFPFGLFIGASGAPVDSEEPWGTAPLLTTYREDDLREVLVVTNFP